MGWCYRCEDEDYHCNCSQRDFGSKNRYATNGVHIMNKAEAKVCRKLMSDTGLSEKELREHKKYRKLLSDAQREGSKENGYYEVIKKRRDRLMKRVTKITKLAKEHPDTIKLFNEFCDHHNKTDWKITNKKKKK